MDVRSISTLESPVPLLTYYYPEITEEQLAMAVKLAAKLLIFFAKPYELRQRLTRVLQIYTDARCVRGLLDSLHQYCRCIEGFILPETGETGKQFKSRTELFVGPRMHNEFEELYNIRSAVEHLHENKYLDNRDKQTRISILKKQLLAELVARTSVQRIILDDKLCDIFSTTTRLAEFWGLTAEERRLKWGDFLNPSLMQFDCTSLTHSELGL